MNGQVVYNNYNQKIISILNQLIMDILSFTIIFIKRILINYSTPKSNDVYCNRVNRMKKH